MLAPAMRRTSNSRLPLTNGARSYDAVIVHPPPRPAPPPAPPPPPAPSCCCCSCWVAPPWHALSSLPSAKGPDRIAGPSAPHASSPSNATHCTSRAAPAKCACSMLAPPPTPLSAPSRLDCPCCCCCGRIPLTFPHRGLGRVSRRSARVRSSRVNESVVY